MCESSRPNKCESSTSRESEIKRGRHHHNNDSIVAFTDSSILFRFEFFGLSVRACVRACASLLGLNNNIVYLNTLSALHTIFSNIYNGCLFIIRTHLRATFRCRWPNGQLFIISFPLCKFIRSCSFSCCSVYILNTRLFNCWMILHNDDAFDW